MTMKYMTSTKVEVWISLEFEVEVSETYSSNFAELQIKKFSKKESQIFISHFFHMT